MKLAALPIAFAVVAASAAAIAQTPDNALPEGPGKALVSARCSTCHGVGTVLIYKRTKGQWSATVDRMLDKGLVASDEEIDQIVNYLAVALPAPAEPTVSSPPPATTAP